MIQTNNDGSLSPEEVRLCGELLTSIIKEMSKRFVPDTRMIKRAYDLAFRAHGNVRRKSGEPYITHPLNVAKILADAGLEDDVVIAAILHDVVEDTDVTLSDLEKEFGSEIAEMVDAVSQVDRDIHDASALLKRDIDFMSDVKFLKKTMFKNRKAFFVKLADRIHNLRTIETFSPKKQRAKADHTRNILLPAARKMHIFLMVDILESLCLKIEHPDIYQDIHDGYHRLLQENAYSLSELKQHWNNLMNDKNMFHKKGVLQLNFVERYEDSIFRHLTEDVENINNLKSVFDKDHIPLYDIKLVVSDAYKGQKQDLFMDIYPYLHNSSFRLTVMGTGFSIGAHEFFFKLKDRYGTKYRLFISTESELLQFYYGVNEDNSIRAHLSYINEAEPDEPEHNMITVYKKDGIPLEIEEGATVLDFAFKIHPEIGICAKYAILNKSSGKIGLHTRLRPGDMVYVESDHHKHNPENDIPHASIRWFEYLHTREAIRILSRWLEKHPDVAQRNMAVHCGKNHYTIPIGSKILDFAFLVNKDIGLHVTGAYLNKDAEPSPLDTVLKYDDKVEFVTDMEDDNVPEFKWLGIIRTSYAKEILIHYFEQKYPKQM